MMLQHKFIKGQKRYRIDTETLRHYRLKKGYKQYQIDEKLGVTYNITGQLEVGGIRTATEDLLRQLADILEISWKDLVRKQPPTKRKSLKSITDGKRHDLTGKDIHVEVIVDGEKRVFTGKEIYIEIKEK